MRVSVRVRVCVRVFVCMKRAEKGGTATEEGEGTCVARMEGEGGKGGE